MDIKYILSKVDHTLLSQTARESDIIKICDEGIEFGCASVCLPACYVKFAKAYTRGRIPVCTVIGFPNGYSTVEAKCYEAENAVDNGADEIDMVINIGMVKDGRFDEVLSEINSVKNSCKGRLLKVIIETCLLSEDEKIKMCEIVNRSDADYIKTSTGFSVAGATKADIALFAEHIGNGKKIKAAGGISTIDDAVCFLELGAQRLGTSRLVKLAANLPEQGVY